MVHSFEKLYTLYKAQPYPSEMATVEQEKVQSQLKNISAKLNEIENTGRYQEVLDKN